MDELEWLREHSPSTRPSRDTTRRHRTQLRKAIATEGADGTRPRRPGRGRRSRHRVLVTTAVVVGLCAVGAGVVALTSSGGDRGSTVGAPAASDATTAAPARACAGAPPAQLALPAGFGSGVAEPAADATAAPTRSQQVTSWKGEQATIEQRWPADSAVSARLGASSPKESFLSFVDPEPIADTKGVVHRSIVFTFPGTGTDCTALEVTVYGHDVDTVRGISDALVREPFVSSEPLVTTTEAAAVASPDVAACPGASTPGVAGTAVPVVATIGASVRRGVFAQPPDALVDFLAGQRTLASHGYRELQLVDGSIVFAKDVQGNVVTTVHVAPTSDGWAVTDWRASGC